MISLWQDIRYGLRSLRENLGFTAVTVFTLGLGIAANTTVFAWIDSILMRPISGAEEAHAVYALETITANGEVLGNFSFLDYRDYRDHVQAFNGLAVARFTPLTIGPAGKAERLWGELVSGNYFELLRVKPRLGRLFDPKEISDTPESAPLVVLSHHLWQSRFRGDESIVGKKIVVNLHELTVVGVAPADFNGSMPGISFGVWIPLTMAPAMGTGAGTLTFRGTRDLTTTLARLKPGVTLADAAGEAAALAQQLAITEARTNRGIRVQLLPLSEASRGAQVLLRNPLRILMAVCLLLFLIVCANVANLLLVRFTARQKELGIRLSLGAPWGRLLRQLMLETFLLAIAGGGLGVLLSHWMNPSLALLLPPNDLPINFGSPLGGVPLAFTVALCVAATMLCGIVPAIASLRRNLHATLKETGRSETGGVPTSRLRSGIVIAEVALATVALVGTGLFFASFRNVMRVDPGFRLDDILVGQFYLSPLGYTGKQQRAYCVKLQEQLEQQSATAAATYTDTIPLQLGSSPWHQIRVEGYTPAKGEDLNVHRSLIAPGYLKFLEIPLLEGREFDQRDVSGAPDVIVVNQTFARRYFGGRHPIGVRVQIESRWATVVGVAADSRYHALSEGPTPYFYRPFLQNFAPGLNFSFFVKAAGDPASAFATLRREALRADPNAQVYQAMPLAESIGSASYSQKVAAYLLSGLGLASLLLATLGIFGVISYTVARRTQEVAIRVALGANRNQVLRVILPEGVILIGIGLICGISLALVAGTQVEPMLVGVQAGDPGILGGAAGLLFTIGLLATLIPAWRATRVHPARVLRAES